MDEDWGATAGQPTFTLFKNLRPEEEAMKDSFVDIVVYNRWTRSERRLYQRLKAKNIIAKIEQAKCNTIDDITDCLEQLTIIRKEDNEAGENLDDLINRLENMKLKAGASESIEQCDKKIFKIKG